MIALKEFLQDLYIIGISSDLQTAMKVIPKKSLTTRRATLFFIAVKSDDYSETQKLLKADPYLVYQYDSVS